MQQTFMRDYFSSLVLKCYLYDDLRVRVTYNQKKENLQQELLNIIHQNNGQTFDYFFEIPQSQYRQFVLQIDDQLKNVQIEKVPDEYLNAQNNNLIEWMDGNQRIILSYAKEQTPNFDGNEIEKKLLEKSRRLHGRILISQNNKEDLKKNALFLAKYFKRTKPLLIVCPKDEQQNWKQLALKYFQLQEKQIVFLTRVDQEKVFNYAEILIITYIELDAAKQIFRDRQLEICIADKWSNIKDFGSNQYLIWRPILQKSKHVILLQQKNFINVPIQLFPILHIIRPDIFPTQSSYQNRFCYKSENENLHELHYLINKYIIFQIFDNEKGKQIFFKRLKKQIDCEQSAQEQLNKELFLMNITINQLVQKIMKESEQKTNPSLFPNFNKLQIQIFEGKKSEIKKYIESLQQKNQKSKIIVYAAKTEILEKLSLELGGIKCVKLYGDQKNKENIQNFQKDNFIEIGFINSHLDAWCKEPLCVTDIVFAELPIKHNTILNIEERVLPYQENQEIFCHFLFGKNTMDECILSAIEEKYENIQLIFTGEKKRLIFLNEKQQQLQQLEQIVKKEAQANLEGENQQQIIVQKNNDKPSAQKKIPKLKQKCQGQTNMYEAKQREETIIQNSSVNLKSQQKIFKLVRIIQNNVQKNTFSEKEIEKDKTQEAIVPSNLLSISKLITSIEQSVEYLDQREEWQKLLLLQKMFYEEQKQIHILLQNISENQLSTHRMQSFGLNESNK